MEAFEEKIQSYQNFKSNIVVASSQMLRTMSMMEIEMITKDILSFLTKKYKLEQLPDATFIHHVIETTFSNSIIRSESELSSFLKEIDHDYQNMEPSEVIKTIEEELKQLTDKVKIIYNPSLTTCYSDFSRRCTEEITKELRKLNPTEEFENHIIKMKMQLKKELTGVLQKFLDGAYKMIHTQILLKMQNQIELLKNSR